MTPPATSTPHLLVDGHPTPVYTDHPGGGRTRRTEVPTACGRTAPLDDVTLCVGQVECPDCATSSGATT